MTTRKLLVVKTVLLVLSAVACSAPVAEEEEAVGAAEAAVGGARDAGRDSGDCADQIDACKRYVFGAVMGGAGVSACVHSCSRGNVGGCTACSVGIVCAGLSGTGLAACRDDIQDVVDRFYDDAAKCLDLSGDCKERPPVRIRDDYRPGASCNRNALVECESITKEMSHRCSVFECRCRTSDNPWGVEGRDRARPASEPAEFTSEPCADFYQECIDNTRDNCSEPKDAGADG